MRIMRKLTVCTFVALLAFAGPAAAQSTNFGLGAFAGVSLPTGDYGDAAELGFAGGLDLFYPLGMSGLSWLSTASVSAHSVDDPDADGGFLFIPLLTGLRYDIAAGPVGVFVNGQAGAIFNKGPEGDFFGVAVDSDWSTEFGFALGGGVQATENIYAGVKYFPLGDVEFSYGDAEVTGEVSFLEIFVGFGVR